MTARILLEEVVFALFARLHFATSHWSPDEALSFTLPLHLEEQVEPKTDKRRVEREDPLRPVLLDPSPHVDGLLTSKSSIKALDQLAQSSYALLGRVHIEDLIDSELLELNHVSERLATGQQIQAPKKARE